MSHGRMKRVGERERKNNTKPRLFIFNTWIKLRIGCLQFFVLKNYLINVLSMLELIITKYWVLFFASKMNIKYLYQVSIFAFFLTRFIFRSLSNIGETRVPNRSKISPERYVNPLIYYFTRWSAYTREVMRKATPISVPILILPAWHLKVYRSGLSRVYISFFYLSRWSTFSSALEAQVWRTFCCFIFPE